MCFIPRKKVPLCRSQFLIYSNFCEKSWKVTILRFGSISIENTLLFPKPPTKFVNKPSCLSYEWKYRPIFVFFSLSTWFSYCDMFWIKGLRQKLKIYIVYKTSDRMRPCVTFYLQNSVKYSPLKWKFRKIPILKTNISKCNLLKIRFLKSHLQMAISQQVLQIEGCARSHFVRNFI